ncbi:hypothetical protein PAPH110629_14880 [Paenibacillus phoenicis]
MGEFSNIVVSIMLLLGAGVGAFEAYQIGLENKGAKKFLGMSILLSFCFSSGSLPPIV